LPSTGPPSDDANSGSDGSDRGQPPPVYDDLRRLARSFLGGQQGGQTLQPTALVHEVYLRLLRHGPADRVAPPGFFALAARAMRSVIVDHARHRSRLKRGGGSVRVPLDDVVDLYEDRALDLIALDHALVKLGEVDEEQARVIELRFFGGLTEAETAEMLGVSPRTVSRIWRRARAWLRRELGGVRDDDGRPQPTGE